MFKIFNKPANHIILYAGAYEYVLKKLIMVSPQKFFCQTPCKKLPFKKKLKSFIQFFNTIKVRYHELMQSKLNLKKKCIVLK